MRFSVAAVALVLALAFGSTAFAADNGWGNAQNGYGYYHEANN